MAAIIELYGDLQSGWRILTSQDGTVGYRFLIVERVGRRTFAEDARDLANGTVPEGLEQVDLDVDSEHGMNLSEPCAIWWRGHTRPTHANLGVLTTAYIAGSVQPHRSG